MAELYPVLRAVVDEVVVVTDEVVKAVMKRLAVGNKLVVEGSGAMSVAAALATPPERRGKAVCVLSGGSVGAEKLAAVLAP